VVFAGESPINAKFYNQAIDQAPLVGATGARYIAAHSVPRMMDYVREGLPRRQGRALPVVLGVPYDLQKVEYMANQPYETSEMYQPKVGRMHPDPEVVAEAVERLAAASGRSSWVAAGVLWSGSPRTSDQARRPLRRASFQHAARARSFPRSPVRARHHRQLLHALGREMYELRTSCSRSHQPVLLHRRRALLAEGLQDPARRRPGACATG